MKTFALALAAAAALVSSLASAQDPLPPIPPPEPAPAPSLSPAPEPQPAPAPAETLSIPVNHRVEMWRAEIGYRGSFVNDAGYGPFATNQYFAQASFAVSRTIWSEGSWSFAPGLGLDVGGTSATARGQPTSLTMQRLSAPLEGRRHFGPWGYAFVRLAPGLALENAEIDESSAPSALKKSAWMFSTDVSAGYSLLVTPRFDRFEQKARVWVQADVGYGWVVGDELALVSQSGSGSSGNTAGVDLGTLTMAGPFLRLGAAMSF